MIRHIETGTLYRRPSDIPRDRRTLPDGRVISGDPQNVPGAMAALGLEAYEPPAPPPPGPPPPVEVPEAVLMAGMDFAGTLYTYGLTPDSTYAEIRETLGARLEAAAIPQVEKDAIRALLAAMTLVKYGALQGDQA